MRKLLLSIVVVLLLAGCSNSENKVLFTDEMAKPFEIVKYEEKIAPVYGNLIPHIAYAKTDGQLNSLKKRFQVDGFDVDMDQHIVLFVATNSDSCGTVVDGVYDRDNMLSVQLLKPSSNDCDVDPIPHTFVLAVEKGDYEKVQLFDDVVLKSSMDIKE